VRNESTGQPVFSETINVTGVLAKDQFSAVRRFDVPFATDLLATGRFRFEVSVDVGDVVKEYSATRDAETNNKVAVQRWNAPDLRIEELAIVAAPVCGRSRHARLVGGQRRHRADPHRLDQPPLLTNAQGQELASTFVASPEPLAKDGRRYRTATIQVPHGTTAVGAMRFSVTLDRSPTAPGGEIREAFQNVNAEDNNFAVVTRQVQARGYPDWRPRCSRRRARCAAGRAMSSAGAWTTRPPPLPRRTRGRPGPTRSS
jgi:hypothetical protein